MLYSQRRGNNVIILTPQPVNSIVPPRVFIGQSCTQCRYLDFGIERNKIDVSRGRD